MEATSAMTALDISTPPCPVYSSHFVNTEISADVTIDGYLSSASSNTSDTPGHDETTGHLKPFPPVKVRDFAYESRKGKKIKASSNSTLSSISFFPDTPSGFAFTKSIRSRAHQGVKMCRRQPTGFAIASGNVTAG